VFPGEAWIAAALVAVVQRLALPVLRARVGRTLVDRIVAVVSVVAGVTVAFVTILTVYALALHTRVARALVDIGVAEISRPAVIAVTVESVDFVLALPVHAGVGQAFVDLGLAVASGVSRMAAANVRMKSEGVLREGAASCP
jgi:multisubunit Na+/H+ antiporter MnhF subunit